MSARSTPAAASTWLTNNHPSYENKAEVTKYARSFGGIRVIDVQPSSFASTYWQTQSPRPTSEPNAYILPLPYNADTKIPIIDIEADYGRYAVGALNHGVDTVYAASERITPVQMAEQYSAGEYCFGSIQQHGHYTRELTPTCVASAPDSRWP